MHAPLARGCTVGSWKNFSSTVVGTTTTFPVRRAPASPACPPGSCGENRPFPAAGPAPAVHPGISPARAGFTACRRTAGRSTRQVHHGDRSAAAEPGHLTVQRQIVRRAALRDRPPPSPPVSGPHPRFPPGVKAAFFQFFKVCKQVVSHMHRAPIQFSSSCVQKYSIVFCAQVRQYPSLSSMVVIIRS